MILQILPFNLILVHREHAHPTPSKGTVIDESRVSYDVVRIQYQYTGSTSNRVMVYSESIPIPSLPHVVISIHGPEYGSDVTGTLVTP